MIPQTTIAWQLTIRFAAWQGEYFVDMKISITCATILAEYAPSHAGLAVIVRGITDINELLFVAQQLIAASGFYSFFNQL